MTTERKNRARSKRVSYTAAALDGDAPPTTRPRKAKRAELNEATLQELAVLRSALTELLESYEVRVGGMLNDVIAGIRGDASIDEKPHLLTVKAAQAILATIHDSKIKPRKGRAKDFRRLEALIESLAAVSPPPP